MLNFIKADMIRVLKKKSYIVIALTFITYAITLIIILNKNPESTDMAAGLLATAAELLIGIPVFIGVFNDDFHSKSMQTIIGFGTSRKRLVISRYCEFLVILAQAFALLSLMCFIMYAVTGNLAVSGPIFGELWKEFLVIALCASVSMLVVFGAHNTTFGLVLYVFLVADLLGLLLAGLQFVPFFAKHNIDPSSILPGTMIYTAINDGKPIYFVLAAVCYIALPLFLSIKLFEKKELEF